jgi:hypothetical protein
MGVDIPIITSNTGASGKADISKSKMVDGVMYRYADRYSPSSIKIVNDVYREDFERFNFKMLNPDTMTHYK